MGELERKEADPQYWECSTCGNWVLVYVRTSEPPCCNNPKHSTKVVLMTNKPVPKGLIKK